MFLSAVLHVTDVFRLTAIIDNFGSIMTVAIIWGFTMSTLVFLSGFITGNQYRMSGNLIYDFFMGSILNPRIGHLDLKMWAMSRVPWPVLFYTSVSCAIKQYELSGSVSALLPSWSLPTGYTAMPFKRVKNVFLPLGISFMKRMVSGDDHDVFFLK